MTKYKNSSLNRNSSLLKSKKSSLLKTKSKSLFNNNFNNNLNDTESTITFSIINSNFSKN